MWIFKGIGVLLTALSITGYGFLRAKKYEKRVKELYKIYSGFELLKQYIKHGGGEMDVLIDLCFCGISGTAQIENGRFILSSEILNKDDIRFLSSTVSDLGTSDSESEISKIDLYNTLIYERYDIAKADASQKSKLCKIMGICAGLAIGIMTI